MSNDALTEILLSAAEIADLAGVSEVTLRSLEPLHFGSPGHWRINKHGVVVYTETGTAELVDALVRFGATSGAAKVYTRLAVLRQERDALPARAGTPTCRKGEKPAWYNTGSLQ